MSRGFYAVPSHLQRRFRQAISATRDGRASPEILRAWDAVGMGADVVERTHTLDLFDTYAERVCLLPRAEQDPVVHALFGGPAA